MNKDELDGKAESLKGRVKQAAGDLTDNERLHDEGVADEISGDTKDTLGRARREVGEAIEDIGENIKRERAGLVGSDNDADPTATSRQEIRNQHGLFETTSRREACAMNPDREAGCRNRTQSSEYRSKQGDVYSSSTSVRAFAAAPAERPKYQ